MFKPATTSISRVAAPLRSSTRHAQASIRPVGRQAPRFRHYATVETESKGVSNNTQTALILGALGVIGAGGYYLLKPVAEVAKTANKVVNTAAEGGSGLADGAAGIAKAMLPPGAFSLYSALSSQPGGINGFLSNLKDKDLQGVLNEVKKVGGEDVQRIANKVEARVKEAKGRPQDIDWKKLATELKEELPKDKQQYVDMLIGKIPDKEDLNKMIATAKEKGQEQFKAAEKAAGQILQQVEKAKKEGKGQANAFLAGLKQAAPGDVDELIKQLKEAGNKAGLPADTIESWLQSKAKDGKFDAEAMAQQLQDKLQTAAKFLPNDPQDVVKQVSEFSPSLGGLLQQALEQAEVIKRK